jgi:hypothetical protein
MILEERIWIDCEMNKVYEAVADPYRWKEIIPNVSEVCVIYDDGRNQEFTITVEKPTGPETARTIRYCLENKILVFQPKCPHKVRKVQAEWLFLKDNSKTIVVARRELELEEINDENQMTKEENLYFEKFKTNLTKLLKLNLIAFKNHLEHNAYPK